MRRLFFHGILLLTFRSFLGFAARFGESDALGTFTRSSASTSPRKRRSRRKQKKGEPSFSYTAPENWSKKFPTCGGSKQSPINVDMSSVVSGKGEESALYSHISYTHELEDRQIVNTGHALQVDGHWGRLRLPGDKLYYMRHITFHFPSEHTVDGRELVGEMQLVHERHGTRGFKDVAIVSVLLERGHHSKFFSSLGFGHGLPKAGESKDVGTVTLSPIVNLMLGDFVHYEGSLTAPPCTEGAKWYLLSDTLSLGMAQIKDFHKVFPYPNNARPTQCLGDRVVVQNALSVESEKPSSLLQDRGGPSLLQQEEVVDEEKREQKVGEKKREEDQQEDAEKGKGKRKRTSEDDFGEDEEDDEEDDEEEYEKERRKRKRRNKLGGDSAEEDEDEDEEEDEEDEEESTDESRSEDYDYSADVYDYGVARRLPTGYDYSAGVYDYGFVRRPPAAPSLLQGFEAIAPGAVAQPAPSLQQVLGAVAAGARAPPPGGLPALLQLQAAAAAAASARPPGAPGAPLAPAAASVAALLQQAGGVSSPPGSGGSAAPVGSTPLGGLAAILARLQAATAAPLGAASAAGKPVGVGAAAASGVPGADHASPPLADSRQEDK